MTDINSDKLAKTLGRHTRLGVPFTWTIGGVPVDLQTEEYQVRVWVTSVDGETISGPTTATVAGDTATYVMNVGDLADASPTANDVVLIVAVAENGFNTLVSDARAIAVGNWGGADAYTPIDFG